MMTMKMTTMSISGAQLIGSQERLGLAGSFRAHSPLRGEALEPPFGGGDAADVDAACRLAEQAFDGFRNQPPARRAALLEAIAEGLLALGDTLLERAHLETALPLARLQGERQRTVNQLRLFADWLRAGQWQGARLDAALPERQPPRPDLRAQRIAIGPVAVFGASNFPLAFSVAGGDTASALAAGCPVVAKAHPAHPGTSELVGRVIQRAVAEAGLPAGVFSLLHDAGTALGQALVQHPAIQAVGFTGSRRGGLALQALAQARPQPIPVFAELSAVNPVLLLPAALSARAESLAQGFVESLTLGVGQFCTNPGLLIGIAGPALDRFVAAAVQALATRAAGTLLTPGIQRAYQQGLEQLDAQPGVQLVAAGLAAEGAAQARLSQVSAPDFLANPLLQEECFGPSALLVSCRDAGELRAVLNALDGQLTATLQLDGDDHPLVHQLLPLLERRAGRIIANGWPTGVEVCHAMVHGGPFPASSNAQHSSVGTLAMERFLRPVCYQGFPDALLPPALQEANPLQLHRQHEGIPRAPGR